MNVCVVGLGKLGACMAAVMADVGHMVIGVDQNPVTLAKIRNGIVPVDEPGLGELLENDNLTVTSDFRYAVENTDIAFIVVPTPSLDDGSFDDNIVQTVAAQLAGALYWVDKPKYTIVVSSTVMPGTCSQRIQPLVDDVAGRHIPIIYSPEFIALGTVIEDMRHPDMVLVGCDDDGGLRDFIDVMRPVVMSGDDESHPAVIRLGTLDAELAKIAVNAYITMKISFANQMAAICEGLAGAADAHAVLFAVGHDRRIGSSYLKPGGPYGGPCFPRDNHAFMRVAQLAGTDAPLSEATETINHAVFDRIAELIPGERVAILGLTYKPGTPVEDESLGHGLAELFDDAYVHDPFYDTNDPQELVDDHDYVIIATAHDAYRDLDFSKCKAVIDVWGFFAYGDNVVCLGVGR